MASCLSCYILSFWLCSVGANKKFTVQRSFYSATVLQKTIGNFYYVSVIRTAYTVLDGRSTLTFIQLHPMSNAVQPVVRFRPRFFLYINPCPMFVDVQEPDIQLISDWLPPNSAPPTYNAWNQCCHEKFFFWFLDMLYLQGLAIHWTLFCVDSLLCYVKNYPLRVKANTVMIQLFKQNCHFWRSNFMECKVN